MQLERASTGVGRISPNLTPRAQPLLNGLPTTAAALAGDTAAVSGLALSASIRRADQRSRLLRELGRREGWTFTDEELQLLGKTENPLLRTMRLEDVDGFVARNRDIVEAVGLAHQGSDDDLASALVRTSVSPGLLTQFSGYRGNGIGVYFTESGCAANGYMPNYFWLGGGSDSNHNRRVVSIHRAVAPESFLTCRGGGILPDPVEVTTGIFGSLPARITSSSFTIIADATLQHERSRLG